MNTLPDVPGDVSAEIIAAELATAESGPDRTLARVRYRQGASTYRMRARRLQGHARLADAFAKLGGGSLLSATLLLIINGQLAMPVVATAALALLMFVASIIVLGLLDYRIAAFDHAADLVEAALKETER